MALALNVWTNLLLLTFLKLVSLLAMVSTYNRKKKVCFMSTLEKKSNSKPVKMNENCVLHFHWKKSIYHNFFKNVMISFAFDLYLTSKYHWIFHLWNSWELCFVMFQCLFCINPWQKNSGREDLFFRF